MPDAPPLPHPAPEAPPALPAVSVDEFAACLRRARNAGRPIVPVVGAGLSADTGFPVLTSIVRYFGKLHQYIHHGAYLPAAADLGLGTGYARQPWRFVEDFGWPDRFQLNQDLYARLRDLSTAGRLAAPPADGRLLVEWAVRTGLAAVVPQLNPDGHWRYRQLQATISRLVGNPEECTLVNDAFDRDRARSRAYDVLGDWRRLILHFTRYQGDYADALFARFGSGRRPSQGHRFLAFLVKLLGVHTIFTFNFDPLIERTLAAEGLHPTVFSMERGAGLPHPALVGDRVSVIKMHGSTHALLLDEQLDRPLSEEYLRRFDRITGADPLLVVVGCSGSDNRLRDLVAHVVERGARAGGTGPGVLWLHYEDEAPQFLGEIPGAGGGRVAARQTNNPGATLQHVHSWLTGRHPAARTPYLAHVEQPIHLGTVPAEDREYVREIVGRAGDRFPTLFSSLPVFTLLSSLPEAADAGPAPGDSYDAFLAGVRTLDPDPVPPAPADAAPADYPAPSASQALLVLANAWARNGYNLVWIDLESVHTLAAVVGAVTDQCRKYDSALAPSVLPVPDEASAGTVQLAAERVARALRRTRYLVAFDGLETYVWPAGSHHGLTHTGVGGAAVRLAGLVGFLRQLSTEDVGESRVVIGVDDPKSRHSDAKLGGYVHLAAQVRWLRDARADGRIPCVSVGTRPGRGRPRFEDVFGLTCEDFPLLRLQASPDNPPPCPPARLALVLMTLALYRRTRPLACLRRVLGPVVGGDPVVDAVLAWLARSQTFGGLLRQLEGGGFWFYRPLRDYVYEGNTRFTGAEFVGVCLRRAGGPAAPDGGAGGAGHWREAAFQLLLGAAMHQHVARTWYSRTYVQSGDTFAFTEYVYHRLSSVRLLAKLLGLVGVARADGTAPEFGAAVLDAARDCGRLIATADDAPTLRHRFEFESSRGDEVRVLHDLTAAPDGGGDAGALLARLERELRDRHYRELGSLHRAWARSELALRRQIPAEQLLHLSQELLSDELEYRCNRVVIGYGPAPEYSPRLYLDGDTPLKPNPEAEELVDGFKTYLRDLQVKLWVERGDYAACIAARGPDAAAALRAAPGADAGRCHHLLDVANCLLKQAQEAAPDDAHLERTGAAARDLLAAVRGRLQVLRRERGLDRAAAGDVHEAWLRLHHIWVECGLRRVSVFAQDGFTGDPAEVSRWGLPLEALRETVGEGRDAIRADDPRTAGSPRSVVIDPTDDGTLYRQYRSVFHMLAGRWRWLRQVAAGGTGLEAFVGAFGDFEMARGGRDDHDCLVSALVELYYAEARLAQARIALFPRAAGAGAAPARSAYDSARGALQRASEALVGGRRNAIWWRFYFQLVTQYHADRLLLDCARLYESAHPAREACRAPAGGAGSHAQAEAARVWGETLRQYLARLRRGYESLRSAADLFLPRGEGLAMRWRNRLWWELTLGAYAAGRLALSAAPGSVPDPHDPGAAPGPRDPAAAHACVIGQLRWLNGSAGLDTPTGFGPALDRLSALGDLLPAGWDAPRAWSPEESLVERYRIIGVADRESRPPGVS